MLLGNYTNVHYQSLVPLHNTFYHEYLQNRTPAEKETENTTTDEFVYMNDGQTVVFRSVDAEKLKCPACGKSFQRLISHITNKSCNIVKMNIEINELTIQMKAYKEGFRMEQSRKWKRKSREKLRGEKGEDFKKEEQNNQKRKSQAKLKDERGKEAVMKDQNNRKMKSQANLRKRKGSQ